MMQAEWIPVSERLPEKDGDYLVTKERSLRRLTVDISTWFESEEANHGFYEASAVVAWAQLPEPYREEEI